MGIRLGSAGGGSSASITATSVGVGKGVLVGGGGGRVAVAVAVEGGGGGDMSALLSTAPQAAKTGNKAAAIGNSHLDIDSLLLSSDLLAATFTIP